MPHAIGVKIGMIFNMNPYYSEMLGRITALITFVLAFTLAIKKLPKHKLFVTIVLLSPTVLSYIAAYSADGIIIAAAVLLFSYVLNYMHTKEKIKKKDYIVLGILIFILAVSKTAYLPLIAILAFIPKESFEEEQNKPVIVAIFMILGLATALWWMSMGRIYITNGDPLQTNTWIFMEPFNYLVVLFRTTINNGYSYIENLFAGDFLCHSQIQPCAIIPLVFIITTILSLFTDENEEKTTTVQKAITVIIIMTITLMITMMMTILMIVMMTIMMMKSMTIIWILYSL